MQIKGLSRFLFPLIIFCLASSAYAKRGDLLQLQKIQALKIADVKKGRKRIFPNIKIPDPRNGVVVYKVNYETIDLQGTATTASGALVVPDSSSRLSAMPLLSYQHGTSLNRLDVPSRSNIESAVVAITFGGLGYVIAEPDYLGEGDNTGFHPYHHAESEASASIDMLRAARTAAEQLGIVLSDELFLAGYSQGGHATMALHQALERDYSDEFTVTASGPMSGAYDLSHTTLSGVIKDPTKNSVVEVSFILITMNKIYHLYPSLDQVIDPKYSSVLPSLFDGTHDWDDIAAQLPATPRELGKPAFVNDLISESGNELVTALQKNDNYDWKPIAPVHMTYSAGDHDVPPANAQLAFRSMKALGANVEAVKVSDVFTHVQAVEPSFEHEIQWFESFRTDAP